MENFMNTVKERATSQLDSQKARATDGLSAVAGAVRQTTQQLRNDQHDGLAQYVDRAADQLERFSNAMRNKDVDELLRDARQFARQQPALFIGGSFAVGLLAARFLKSSRENSNGAGDRMYDQTGYGSGAATAGAYPVRDRVGDEMEEWSRNAATPDRETF
jgi:hypothetical protein